MDQDELELLLEARAHLSRGDGSGEDDELICECECVSLGEIRGFAKDHKISLETLKEHFNLGAGCSSCVKNYDFWKTKI